MSDREEYYQHVDDVAVDILTELEVGEWVLENQEKLDDAWAFIDDKEYNGDVTSIIDANFVVGREDYMGAIDILKTTNQNPDQVDAGLYEGCNWKQILVIIAYDVFRQDVYDRIGDYFNSGEFPEGTIVYPTTRTQRGFFPEMVTYVFPKTADLVVSDNFVKVVAPLMPGQSFDRNKLTLEVVFEGEVDDDGVTLSILCKRAYTMLETNIDEDLKRCEKEFGVYTED